MDQTNTLIIINIILSFLTPIVIALSSLISHIKSSSCCNGKIKLKTRESFNDQNHPTEEKKLIV